MQDSNGEDDFRAEIASRALMDGIVKGQYIEFRLTLIMRQDGHRNLFQLLIDFNAWSVARSRSVRTKVEWTAPASFIFIFRFLNPPQWRPRR